MCIEPKWWVNWNIISVQHQVTTLVTTSSNSICYNMRWTQHLYQHPVTIVTPYCSLGGNTNTLKSSQHFIYLKHVHCVKQSLSRARVGVGVPRPRGSTHTCTHIFLNGGDQQSVPFTLPSLALPMAQSTAAQYTRIQKDSNIQDSCDIFWYNQPVTYARQTSGASCAYTRQCMTTSGASWPWARWQYMTTSGASWP